MGNEKYGIQKKEKATRTPQILGARVLNINNSFYASFRVVPP